MLFWLIWILFVILLFASFPTWPYSRGWGYYPGGILLVWLIFLLVLWWFTWLPGWGHYSWWR